MVKIEILRDCVVKGGRNGVKGEVLEVEKDLAIDLYQAGAAKPADDDAELGKPKASTKK